MRSALASDVITKVPTITTLNYFEIEVFMANMTTMMLDSYDALESTLTQMKNINLASFPGENVSDFCT